MNILLFYSKFEFFNWPKCRWWFTAIWYGGACARILLCLCKFVLIILPLKVIVSLSLNCLIRNSGNELQLEELNLSRETGKQENVFHGKEDMNLCVLVSSTSGTSCLFCICFTTSKKWKNNINHNTQFRGIKDKCCLIFWLCSEK